MSQIAVPIFYALLIWWLSTGVILYAVGQPRQSYPISVAIAGTLLTLSLWFLPTVSNGSSAWDALLAFTGAIVVWGFVELTFLTGYVTGIRTTTCPTGSSGWRRMRYATEAIIYHEVALLAAGAAIATTTWNGTNRVAAATFLVLWVMRLSSKFNLFLGVRTLNEELLPPQLQHLCSYFLRRDMNPLYPVSVIGATFVTGLLVLRAISPDVTEFDRAGFLLLASLLALALIEHVFMMLPVPIAKLWGLERRAQAAEGQYRVANRDP
jgi:putative photosynthetic complex assembly protein 2